MKQLLHIFTEVDELLQRTKQTVHSKAYQINKNLRPKAEYKQQTRFYSAHNLVVQNYWCKFKEAVVSKSWAPKIRFHTFSQYLS